jgi:hypothetical protein
LEIVIVIDVVVFSAIDGLANDSEIVGASIATWSEAVAAPLPVRGRIAGSWWSTCCGVRRDRDAERAVAAGEDRGALN